MTDTAKWSVVLRPEGKNDDQLNTGGMVILVSDGVHRTEVSRVAFIRRNGKNPDVDYETQLDHEVGKARKSVEILNEQFTESGVLQ